MAGNITTKYLPEVYPDGFRGKQLTVTDRLHLTAIAACFWVKNDVRSRQFTNEPDAMLSPPVSQWSLAVTLAEQKIPCRVQLDAQGNFSVDAGGQKMNIKGDFSLAAPVVEAQVDQETHIVQLINKQANGGLRIRFKGTAFPVTVMTSKSDKFMALMPEKPKVDVSKVVISPMPGLVKSVSCKVGDAVGEGQELLVIGMCVLGGFADNLLPIYNNVSFIFQRP